MSDLKWKRSFWRDRFPETWSFFCPLCRAARRLSYRPKPGSARHFAQLGLTAAVFTLATWNWFEWKGIVSFLPLWTAFEVLYRWRLRAALICTQCGFDPVMYMVDVPRARLEVQSHWRKKFAERGIPWPGEEPAAGVALATERVSSLPKVSPSPATNLP